jgi:hypothetical protein
VGGNILAVGPWVLFSVRNVVKAGFPDTDYGPRWQAHRGRVQNSRAWVRIKRFSLTRTKFTSSAAVDLDSILLTDF